MKVTVEGGKEAEIPAAVQAFSHGALKSRKHVEDELDQILNKMRDFWEMEPDMVLKMIAAMSARVTEICVHLARVENKREFFKLRTMQAENVLAELDRQFKLASRLIEVRRQDLETLR